MDMSYPLKSIAVETVGSPTEGRRKKPMQVRAGILGTTGSKVNGKILFPINPGVPYDLYPEKYARGPSPQ
jgi:hypothetical protein